MSVVRCVRCGYGVVRCEVCVVRCEVCEVCECVRVECGEV